MESGRAKVVPLVSLVVEGDCGRVGASRLFAAEDVSNGSKVIKQDKADLLALVFLLLRLRRLTRFFLHFALIFGDCGCVRILKTLPWI